MTLNLLDWRTQQRQQQKFLLNIIAAALFIVSCSLIISRYFHDQQLLITTKNKTNQLNLSLKKIVINDTKQHYQLLQQQIQYALQQRENLYRFLGLLYDSQQSLPEALYLTAINWQPPWLVLQGVSLSPEAVSRWQQQLRDNKFVRHINPAYRHISVEKHDEFSLKILLR